MYILTAFLKSIGLVLSAVTVYLTLDLSHLKRFPIMSSSTVFTTDTLPTDDRLMATIGNGYLATRVFSDTIYVSGVYNGRRREPSHRARVPSTAATRDSSGKDAHTTNYSLDVAKGIFRQQSEGDGFHVEEVIYDHRQQQHEHLVVVELRLVNNRDETLTVKLSNNNGNQSEDIDFDIVAKSQMPPDISDKAEAMFGEIKTTEEESSERVGVAVVSSTVPDSVTLEARTNRTWYFLTAIVSSLNAVDYLESAFDVYQEAIKNVDGLLKGHVDEWANLWGKANIEIEGDLKLAQAVSGSLYYILRYVLPG